MEQNENYNYEAGNNPVPPQNQPWGPVQTGPERLPGATLIKVVSIIAFVLCGIVAALIIFFALFSGKAISGLFAQAFGTAYSTFAGGIVAAVIAILAALLAGIFIAYLFCFRHCNTPEKSPAILYIGAVLAGLAILGDCWGNNSIGMVVLGLILPVLLLLGGVLNVRAACGYDAKKVYMVSGIILAVFAALGITGCIMTKGNSNKKPGLPDAKVQTSSSSLGTLDVESDSYGWLDSGSDGYEDSSWETDSTDDVTADSYNYKEDGYDMNSPDNTAGEITSSTIQNDVDGNPLSAFVDDYSFLADDVEAGDNYTDMPSQQLYTWNGLTITATGFEEDDTGVGHLYLNMQNEGGSDIDVSSMAASVNGLGVTPGMYETIPAGEARDVDCTLDLAYAKQLGITKAGTCKLELSLEGGGEKVTPVVGIKVTTSTDQAFLPSGGSTLYNNNGIRLIYDGAGTDGTGNPVFWYEVSNTSGIPVSIGTDDIYIDGKLSSGSSLTGEILDGSTAMVPLYLDSDQYDEASAREIRSITTNVEIMAYYEPELYTTVLELDENTK